MECIYVYFREVGAMVIAGFFSDVYEALINGLKEIFFWFIDLIVSAFATVLNGVVEAFPEFPETWSTIIDYCGYANYWLPISEMIVIMNAYIAFMIVQTILKLGIKLFIPSVG